MDGVGQLLSEPDRPTREVPETGTRTTGPTGQQYTEIGAHNDLHGEPRYFLEDLLILGFGQRSRHGAINTNGYLGNLDHLGGYDRASMVIVARQPDGRYEKRSPSSSSPGRRVRNGVRPALVMAALTLSVVLSPAAGAAANGPIQPGNQPTPIPGAINGELPSSDLVNVAPGCQAARAAGPSLGLLLAEARDRGVVLGTEQCYRSLQGQQGEDRSWTAAGNSACAAPVVTSPSGQLQDTSMHGWGKAADFSGSSGTVTFGSPGYAFLKAYAGQVGWNHPGWAEPGGRRVP